MFLTDDTIVAIASPLSPAMRGIVRLTGDDVLGVLERLNLLHQDVGEKHPRRYGASLELAAPLGQIDVAVMLWPNRRSYTGQPSAELHLIGSLPILQAVVDAAMGAGARAARPGEFTMRSFLAGRLDLTQAEAVLGVIEAEDRGALHQALGQLAGNLSQPLEFARSTLLNLLADVEAGLDFVDEDIEFISDETLLARLGEVSVLVKQTLEQLETRGSQSNALNVVLRGLPNAGKSCLLNAISESDTAIVTSQAGTTRDVVNVSVDVAGHRVRLTDTAGMEVREASDPEAEVLNKAQLQAEQADREADVCLFCVDCTTDAKSTLNHLSATLPTDRKKSIVDLCVLTKADLEDAFIAGKPSEIDDESWLRVSSVTRQGLNDLRERLIAIAESRDAVEIGSVIGTAARCRQSLMGAHESLGRAYELVEHQVGHELAAAEIRIAVSSLGEVTGQVYTDDILDRVFSRFCIGK